MVKKIMRHSLSVLILFLLLLAIQAFFNPLALFNPLRRSPERIRESMLELTPIGMDINEVVLILQESRADSDWISLNVNRRVGVDLTNLGGLSRVDREAYIERLGLSGNTAGEQSIRVILGGYRGIAWTSVHGYWAFDENGDLMEVFVRKYVSFTNRSQWENMRN